MVELKFESEGKCSEIVVGKVTMANELAMSPQLEQIHGEIRDNFRALAYVSSLFMICLYNSKAAIFSHFHSSALYNSFSEMGFKSWIKSKTRIDKVNSLRNLPPR